MDLQEQINQLKKENLELKEKIERSSKQRGQNQKSGMIKKASSGKIMSKPAFGYKVEQGKLIKIEENAKKIQDIFQDFLQNSLSLNDLAKKYNFSVNGVKKIHYVSFEENGRKNYLWFDGKTT